ncbi:MAG TPA: bifunctional folylpolyglutamate synthase/dihydrofolate synthase, partial [Thermoplasmatales archaeon]|nr:bifunctional folylpolyglutamate synthase/dihydrofolate synthase [Thermoplasmatales archaeon]
MCYTAMATKSMKGFEDMVQRLYALRRFGIKLGLERISTLVNKLGNPHLQYDTIHVGGTNGKGSVCRILGSVLTEAGYTTGVYTSPHLSQLRERVTVDGVAISDDDLSRMIKEVMMFVNKTKVEGSPTFFEVVTALAFEYFKRRKVDVAVIEVGLGGRHDATNIIQPMLTILTDISVDHRNLLGETVEEIAEE